MKKYFIVFSVFILLFLWLDINIKAESEPAVLATHNLIEIKSIHFNEGTYTIDQQINLETNKMYTMYMGVEVFGSNMEYRSSDQSFHIFIHYGPYHISHFQAFREPNELMSHVTFLAEKEIIYKIVINTTNEISSERPHFMLFQGRNDSFPGFLNYKDEDYEMPSEEVWVYLVTKENPVTIAEAITKMSANYDDEDLLIRLLSENYTENQTKYGTYDVNIALDDSSGNTYRRTSFKIRVLDDIPAQIVGPDTLEVIRQESFNIYSILEHYHIEDNDPIASYIELDDEGFDITTLGTYQVTLFAYDWQDNRIEKIVTIEVIDATNPTIIRKNELIYTYGEIAAITQEDILEQFTIRDDEKYENLTITFEGYDEYVASKSIPGDYEVSIKVKDLSGNEATHSVKIRVVKRSNVNINVDDRFFLTVERADKMTLQDIKDWFLNQLQEIDYSVNNIEVIYSEYEVSSKPGRYYVHFSYKSKDGEFRERVAIDVIAPLKGSLNSIQISLIIVASIALLGAGGFLVFKKLKNKRKVA